MDIKILVFFFFLYFFPYVYKTWWNYDSDFKSGFTIYFHFVILNFLTVKIQLLSLFTLPEIYVYIIKLCNFNIKPLCIFFCCFWNLPPLLFCFDVNFQVYFYQDREEKSTRFNIISRPIKGGWRGWNINIIKYNSPLLALLNPLLLPLPPPPRVNPHNESSH